MKRSDLISQLASQQEHLAPEDVEAAVKALLDQLRDALGNGERIEIRGFGSFSLHYRPPRQARNPKTGETVSTTGKYSPHFKPGKELRERVNQGSDRNTPV
jgi:integration host factor subunit beta